MGRCGHKVPVGLAEAPRYCAGMRALLRSISSALAASRGPRFAPALPDGLRVYAFGDVHGRADLLQILLAEIVRDGADCVALGGQVRIIGLGDYVDRGPASRQAVDVLRHVVLPPGFALTLLKGNHEQALLTVLNEVEAMASWLEFGGGATLASYGVAPIAGAPTAERVGRMWAALKEALPPEHRAFLAALPSQCRIGDYLFVHAGIRPGLALERQSDDDLLWIRHDFLSSRRRHPAMIVHGHHIVDVPEILPNRIGLDTGAYCTGILSCLVLEGAGRSLLQVTPNGIRRTALPPK